MLDKLRSASEARQNSLDELTLLKQRSAWEKAREEQKEFSLNLDDRMAQQRKDIAFRDDLNKRLETKDQKKALPAPTDDETNPDGTTDPADAPVKFDIQLRESLRIMGDWLNLTPGNSSAPKVAAASSADSATATH